MGLHFSTDGQRIYRVPVSIVLYGSFRRFDSFSSRIPPAPPSLIRGNDPGHAPESPSFGIGLRILRSSAAVLPRVCPIRPRKPVDVPDEVKLFHCERAK